ncbi:hypothetical protein CVS40_9160 [Lucilia cuprina]|nr:hypothetical protein CVS40_9160 [Lucilia cuprina]
MVIDTARSAIEGQGSKRNYCAIINLDIKTPLTLRIGVNNSKTKKDRHTVSVEGNRNLFHGVPCFVHGVPCFVHYYQYTRRSIIRFADDIAVTVSGRFIDEVELIANEVLCIIKNWIKNACLEIAEHKTEIVIISTVHCSLQLSNTLSCLHMGRSSESKVLSKDNKISIHRNESKEAKRLNGTIRGVTISRTVVQKLDREESIRHNFTKAMECTETVRHTAHIALMKKKTQNMSSFTTHALSMNGGEQKI